MPTITTHLVTIDPPDEYRPTYLVACSQLDLNRATFHQSEAQEIGHGHVVEVIRRAELAKGYEFHEGDMEIPEEIRRLLDEAS